MPYWKLDSTELLAATEAEDEEEKEEDEEEEEEEEGGLEDVADPCRGCWDLAGLPWAPGDSLAGEGLCVLTSALGRDSRGPESSDGLEE